jgi:Tol biopolymer transport system component
MLGTRGLFGVVVVTIAALLAAAGVASAATDDLRLVSRAGGATGVKGNDGSTAPALAPGGRFVALSSNATNLHPDDADAVSDVFVRDLQAGTLVLVSRASGAAGAKGDGSSGVPSISADGRFVAFASSARNLVAEDTDATGDVFVRDLQTSTTTLVSRATGAGAKSNADSFTPAISANGRFVTFASNASNLSPDDTDAATDIFVRDLQTGALALVSRADGAAGAKGSSGSAAPRISADGARIAFSSNAPNLDPDDPDAAPDVFVRDVRAQTTTLVSRAADGGASDGDSFSPTISADGRFVAFGSSATNLHHDDSDAITDVFVRDLLTGTTLLASRAGGSAGPKGNGFSDEPAIAGDGHSVTFVSNATNLHPDDTDVTDDVFVRDLQSSSTRLVSRASSLTKGSGFSLAPSISDSGATVTFASNSANLTPDDPDTIVDVFARDVPSTPPAPPTGPDQPPTTGRPQPGCPLRGLQIVGTPRADRRSGTGGTDVMFGLAGDDVLAALAGPDCVFGGVGNDRLSGGTGNDLLFGEPGADRLLGGVGNDRLSGGTGNDLLFGEPGADRLLGEGGDDRLSGGTGNDLLSGQRGADRLLGEGGDDRLSGGTGNDVLDGGAGADSLNDAGGRDRFAGGAGADRINARDRTPADRRRADVVRCGRGRDLAVVDRADRVARDCERVRRR